MYILPYLDKYPQLADNVFVAQNACVVGDVHLGVASNVWYNVTIRGDVAPVYVGQDTNIQDNTVIHTSRFNGPCTIGASVTIGHTCILHACNVHDFGFIGMGAVIMDKVVVASYGFVAAKALVPPGKVVGSYELWAGVPAKFVRKLTEHEIFLIEDTPPHYKMLAQNHRISQTNPNI